MATFQTVVLSTATVILIIALCFIGLSLYRQKYNSTYPPVMPNCPDYWDMSGNLCINKKTPPLGNPACPKQMDFSTGQWKGQDGLCNKYKWAQQCNLVWDGISDNADICDSGWGDNSSWDTDDSTTTAKPVRTPP